MCSLIQQVRVNEIALRANEMHVMLVHDSRGFWRENNCMRVIVWSIMFNI